MPISANHILPRYSDHYDEYSFVVVFISNSQ